MDRAVACYDVANRVPVLKEEGPHLLDLVGMDPLHADDCRRGDCPVRGGQREQRAALAGGPLPVASNIIAVKPLTSRHVSFAATGRRPPASR